MGFLDRVRQVLSGRTTGRSSGGSSFGEGDSHTHFVYARCRRCCEPLMGRVNMMSEPSQEEDDTWIVRKQLSGSGKNFCFQTVEVTLHFDTQKKNLLDTEVSGGTLLSAEEYARLVQEQAAAAAQAAQDESNEQDEPSKEA